MPQGNVHKSVYIVEDDIELSTMLDRILKSIDHHMSLDWSTTAEEAIQTMNRAWKSGIERPYDLIVVDVYLDGAQNGLDFYQMCRREYPNIPVVMTSAGNPEKIFPNSVEKPLFLQKPFSMNECKKLFKNLLMN